LVLCTVLPFFALTTYTAISAARDDVADARTQMLSLAKLVGANIEELLGDSASALTLLSQRPAIRAIDPAHCDQIIADFAVLDRKYVDLGVVRPDGEVICSGLPRPQSGHYPSVAGTEWFKQVMAEKRLIFGHPYYGLLSKTWVSVIAMPIRDEAGVITGILALPLRLNRIEPVKNGAGLPGGTFVTIIDDQGTVVARSEDSSRWVGRRLSTNRIIDATLATVEGTGEGKGELGVERIFGFTTVMPSNWHVVAGISTETVLEPVRSALIDEILAIAGLTVLAAALAFRLARGIAVPLEEVGGAARAVASGRLDTHLDLRGPSEIVAVAEQFNQMLEVRRTVERSLSEARDFAETLIDAANALVVGLDVEGCVVIFNRVAEQCTGYSKSEIMGRNWFDIVVPRDRYPEVWRLFEGIVASGGRPETFENPILTKDGRELVIGWSSTYFPVERAGLATLSFGIDVTERRQSEMVIESLVTNTIGRAGQEHFDSLVRWLCDWLGGDACVLAVLEPSGRARSVAAVSDGAPFEAVYMVEETPWQVVLRDGFLHMPDAVAGMYPRDQRLNARAARGFVGVAVVDRHGQSLGVLAVVSRRMMRLPPRGREIMALVAARTASELERLAAEGRVREIYDLNQRIISETTSGILAYRDDGRCVLANPAAARVIGGSTELMLRQNFNEMTSWRASGLFDLARTVLDTGESRCQSFEMRTSFGHDAWLKCALSRFYVQGKPHLMMVFDDVTEHRRVERLLIEAKQAAEFANRAKGEFLANMSHEIRTPMNAIFGLSHLALRADPSPRQRDYLEKIHSSAFALLGIVNDVLDFSKIEAGRMEIEAVDVRLDEVLGAVSQMVALQASQKGLELVVSIPPDLPQGLVGDPLRLRQVALNLVSNAVKFTEHGEVVVSVDVVSRDDEQVVLRFQVRDTGIGISPEQRHGLFRAFAQADGSMTRRYGGTGLGLVISKRLVEMMGGEIDVDSTPGQGSRFWFTVPFGVNAAEQRPSVALANDLHGLRVLVVDDSDTARIMLVECLRNLSFRAESCASGEEALVELVRATGEGDTPYDLVLLDWKMPGMDGVETARRIRDELNLTTLPTIFMVTAYDRNEVLDEAGGVGLDEVLSKPVTPSTLVDAIMQAFGREVVDITHAMGGGLAGGALPGLQGARVLVVEDNEINRQVASEMLEAVGVVVAVAEHGAAAVEMLGRDPRAFDAVLMDVQMPVMDGLEATRRLRDDPRFKHLPIIAMTAHVLDDDRARCARAGMDDYVAKPIHPRTLCETLARCLHRDASLSVARIESPARGTLPGLDVDGALERLAGKMPLYLRLLGDFERDWASAPGRLATLWEARLREEASQMIHTLKGVAGNLGAVGVAQAASELLRALKASDGDIGGMLPSLGRELRTAFDAATHLSRMSAPPSLPLPAPSQTSESLADALDRLDNLLSRNNVAAIDASTALAARMGRDRHGALLTKLEANATALDFRGARAILSALRAAMVQYGSSGEGD
jgi:PAS domain S-box-containing protein